MRLKLRQISRTRLLSAEERARLLLDERTERLAGRSGDRSVPEVDTARMMICRVREEYFGIPLELVAEVLSPHSPVPVPNGPAALIGVLGHGGHLISVIDLGVALGLSPSSSDGDSGHLVLLRREHPRIALGVNRAVGVGDTIPLASSETRDFRSEAVVGYAKAVSGFADRERVLSLLDIDRLLRPFLSPSPVPGV
jgi:purine-binding chemotaxis protein CheW